MRGRPIDKAISTLLLGSVALAAIEAALKTLTRAAATGRIGLSPAPAGGSSGRLISTMSTASGASVMSRDRIGESIY